MRKFSEKENIVIVGGGLSGVSLAKELSAKLDHSKYDLIVVESRPYLVYMIGGARMAVTTEEGAVDKYLFKYDKLFSAGKGTVKNAKVEKIVPNSDGKGGELELTGGETLAYRCTSHSRFIRTHV
jgi:NADH dehydrogenase FAD-containing subunit